MSAVDYAALVLSKNPVAFYRLEGATATADETGNGHTLTFSGSPTKEQAGVISDDEAVLFDGVDDDATIANEGDLEIFGDTTLEAWIFPTGTGEGGIVTYRGTSNLYEWYWNDEGRLKLWIDGWGLIEAAIGTLPSNQWHHVVATIDWIGTTDLMAKLYANGVQVASSQRTGQPTPAATSIRIGSRNSSGLYFGGSISEVAFYDSVLSAPEVADHHHAMVTWFGIGETEQLLWDAHAVVGETEQLLWDAHAAIGEAAQLLWDVGIPVGESLGLLWDVRPEIIHVPGRTYVSVGPSSTVVDLDSSFTSIEIDVQGRFADVDKS